MTITGATGHNDRDRRFRNAEAPKILLTDTVGFPGAAQLAVSLSKAGCDVFAVCSISDNPLRKVRAIREKLPYSSVNPVDSLIAAIERVQPQIIIPCDDTAVQHLHELHAHASQPRSSNESIARLLERSLGSPESYPIVRSRYRLLGLAREEGLRVPETSLLYSLEEVKAYQVDTTRPLVLKADGTWGGNGVRIARTSQQASDSFVELNRPLGTWKAISWLLLNRNRSCLRRWWAGATPEIIAQDYIFGRPANCAVFCWKGRVLAGISVEVVSTRKQNGPASVVRVVNHPEMQFAAQRIARRLELSGFFGLDFIIEDTGKAAYLIEMNPRCTQPCHLRLGKDRDMVAALHAALTGRPQEETLPVTRRPLIAYFPEAWLADTELMSESFRDIPQNEPELVQALLKDSSDRTLLGRLVDYFRRLRSQRGAVHAHVQRRFFDHGGAHPDILHGKPEA